MPGAVRLELDREIIRHRSQHRSRYYDLLRNDPRFAPWIGSHRGCAGEKRLDRYIADLRKNQPKKMSASAAARAAAAAAGAGESADAVEELRTPRADVLAGGGAAVSYEELQVGLRKRLRLNELMTDQCINEFGEVTDKPLLVKLTAQYLVITAASPSLTKSLHHDLNSEPFVGRALARILQAAPDLPPEEIEALRAGLRRDFLEANGLGAASQ
jgi:hypothetical protein